ncbi:MAG: hypothetical protein Fur0041_15040 [Bacteroidia bacterium]
MNQRLVLFLIVTAVWFGFVCAISFMEAPLKFTAPGITIPLGLGIGRIVFHALNKVEWVLALLSGFLILKSTAHRYIKWTYLTTLLILILQTLWVLPALDLRAQIILDGGTPPPSSLHLIYIFMDVVKVLSFPLMWWMFFKSNHQQAQP